MSDVQIHPLGTEAAPADWTLPAGLEILPKAVFAHFDGTAAAAFLPTLQILSDAGTTVCEIPMSTTVAAGASVDASWFPGARVAAAGAGGSGIQFDVDNVGDWLEVETTSLITTPFSKPAGIAFGVDETNFGAAVNAAGGSLFTTAPQTSTAALSAENAYSGANAWDIWGMWTAVDCSAATGAASANGLVTDVEANSGQAFGVLSQVSSVGGHATGVKGIATNSGANDAVGVMGQGHSSGAGIGMAFLGLNNAGKKIFEVRDDGSIHGLASVGTITWDLV